MKNSKKSVFGFLLTFLLFKSVNVAAQQFTEVDKAVKEVIAKSYAATVKIWGIDSLSGKQNSAQFSGVVITQNGWILTAAHAIIPGNYYQVNFVDGKFTRGKAMGRMAIKSMQGRPDIGLIKITENGTWPFAEMGWSDSMSPNDLCVSIAYPSSLALNSPTIRVGVVSNPLDQWGFLISTCKMESGDSGGPIFDNLGRVIGIHSRIDVKEEINYESPVNLFRQYWESLVRETNYTELPSTLISIPSDSLKSEILNVDRLKSDIPSLNMEVVQVQSELDGNRQLALGTHIRSDLDVLKRAKEYSWIVTKSSLIGINTSVKVSGKSYKADVFARDDCNDLALLRMEKINVDGIDLQKGKTQNTVSFSELGESLVSLLPEGERAFSALSSTVFNQNSKLKIGFFGAGANFIDNKIIITHFSQNSPAEQGGLKLQDEVKVINGVSISKPPHYGRELMKYAPGDSVKIFGIRGGKDFNVTVVMGNSPSQGSHPAYKFEGGRSLRFDGFDEVFAHDAKLKPKQCGGPVFKADGTFVGINIARFSRTCSLVLPEDIIYNFVETAFLNKNKFQ